MKNITFLIITLFFVNYCVGQNDTMKKKPSQIETQNSKEANNAELTAYKLLYETTKKNTDDLRTTMQWTIGIVIAFIIVILGSQFWYNWKLNKQEIVQIKNEVDIDFQELSNSLLMEKNEIFNTLKKDINLAKKEIQTELLERLEKSQNVNEKFSDFYQKETDKKILQLKTEIQELDAEIWLLKGVEANALSGFIKTAQYKLDLGQELKYTLDDIIPILSKLEEVHDMEYSNLDKLLASIREKFKGRYEEQLEKIEKNYKKKQTYIYQDSRHLGGMMHGLGLFTSKKIIRPAKG